jgi:formamidopyrimidine-DNA glycosylase
MPELPEVETIKNFLAKAVTGYVISEVLVLNHKLRYIIPEEIASMDGAKILNVARRAKYIQMFLDNSKVIIFHLGMSGRLLTYDGEYSSVKHDHMIMLLGANLHLVYHDPRRFGFIDLVASSEIDSYKGFRNLGIEPLTPCFDLQALRQMLEVSSANIKSFLMNSDFIVGIGNIYASEILFAAKIHPLTLASKIPQNKLPLLLASIKSVLIEAINLGGSSIQNFVNPEGNKGHFSGAFAVYARHKQNCVSCGSVIEKIIIVQRSTFFCPKCQML